MNRAALRALVRQDLDDVATPYLWSDDYINARINVAIGEAARRARLITDSTTAAICQIQTTNGNPLYDLDSRVIFVRHVHSSLRTTELDKIRVRDLHARYPGWSVYEGDVTHYCTDYQTGKLLVVRKPVTGNLPLLSMTVVRMPLVDLTSDLDDSTGTPEIAPRYHADLRHHVVELCYMKPDEATYRPDLAGRAGVEFAKVFGKPSTAQDERWIHENHGYDGDEGLY